jgi:pimeloyl-ACP methyl ester carboxylesterase
MFKKRNLSVFTILMAGLLMAGVALAANVPNDQPDSSAYVGYGWNCFLPAFKDEDGVSIPFLPAGIRPPIGYQGDFYVDEFTDAKIKQAWQELKEKDPAAAKKILASIPEKSEYRSIGALDPNGAVNGNNDLKLTEVRRPKYFGQAPYFEEIAKAEQDTYTVEFTVPRGPCERLYLKLTDPIKLRGWFIKGKGVPNAKGQKVHALVIYNSGCGRQLCATEHQDAPAYVYDVQTMQYTGISSPNKNYQTEQGGNRTYRQFLYAFNQAGFDVLCVDKRGHGYSGGITGRYDNSEHAEDVFRMLDQLESGEGLSILTPTGQMLQGKQTAGLLLRGIPAKQVPVIVGGESQGSNISLYAMHKNYVGWTAYNEPGQKFTPARKYNLKAAILLSEFTAGIGYNNLDYDPKRVYQQAAVRVERYLMWEPTSEILANIDKWSAVFFGQGLWDKYQSPEGTYESYRRAKGLKELVFYRGQHGAARWGAENIAHLINKMTEFAVRAVVNPGKKYPELKSFKEAVLSSPPYWDPTTRP